MAKSRDELIKAARRQWLIKQAKANWQKKQSNPEPEPMTIQAQHPAITASERAIAKNLSQTPDKMLGYYQAQHPDMEFEALPNGQIRARAKGERDWMVDDPDTGFFSSDFLSDAGDIGSDVVEGLAEAGAGALGAIGGGIAGAPGGPVGSVAGGTAGAMAASGATATGLQAAKVKLGQYLGIPQENTVEDLAITGGLAAAGPALFGANKIPGALPYLGGKAAGLAGKGIKKANPFYFLAEKASGRPRELYRNYYDDGVRATMTQMEEEGTGSYLKKTQKKIKDYFDNEEKVATKNLVEAIEGTGAQVDMKPAKKAFDETAKKLKKRDIVTNADRDKARQVMGIKKNVMGRYQKPVPEAAPSRIILTDAPAMPVVTPKAGPKYIPDELSASRAWDIQKDLKLAAAFETDMTPATRYAKGTARKSYNEINKALDAASDGVSGETKNAYRKMIEGRDNLLPYFGGKTPAKGQQKIYNSLTRLENEGNMVLKNQINEEAARKGGLDLTKEIRDLSTFRHLGNRALLPVKSGGKVDAMRAVPLSVATGALGTLAGYNSGGGYAGATVGGMAGAGLGAMAGSPSAMKFLLRRAKNVGNLKDGALKRAASPYAKMLTNALAIEKAQQEQEEIRSLLDELDQQP